MKKNSFHYEKRGNVSPGEQKIRRKIKKERRKERKNKAGKK